MGKVCDSVYRIYKDEQIKRVNDSYKKHCEQQNAIIEHKGMNVHDEL